jgi:calcineurin-like phosphoesterase family protein
VTYPNFEALVLSLDKFKAPNFGHGHGHGHEHTYIDMNVNVNVEVNRRQWTNKTIISAELWLALSNK